MDPIKEAFDKIKQDILFLKEELSSFSYQIVNLREEISNLKQDIQINKKEAIPAHPTHIPTDSNPIISTPTHIPTQDQALESPEVNNNAFSIRNRGVPTDKPTNQQTNQHILESSYNHKNLDINSFEKASEILGSLDAIRKDIRLKFKRLTPQEMLIFSTLYTLEEQDFGEVTYKTIAQHLRLSESSIRDYITKIKSKGIPVSKNRLNNKQISLTISSELKKLTNLSTILKLRDL